MGLLFASCAARLVSGLLCVDLGFVVGLFFCGFDVVTYCCVTAALYGSLRMVERCALVVCGRCLN